MEDGRQGNRIPGIKICGLTSVEEAEWVVEEAVDYAGIVLFYPKSHRNMTIEEAGALLPVIRRGKALSGEPIKAVAVTVSPTPEQVRRIQSAGFDLIQIHGELTKETYEAVWIPIIRAYNGLDREAQETARRLDKVAAYLFDAGEPGSGRIFDWEMLRSLPRDGKPIFLAGGLHADNVARAIREVAPDAVDVSRGVEKDAAAVTARAGKNMAGAPGCSHEGADNGLKGSHVGKDRDKIRAFVKAVRGAKEER